MTDTPPPLDPPSQSPSSSPQPQPQPPSSGSGKKVALGCGLGCLAVLVVAVVLAVIGFQFMKGQTEKVIEEFTAAEPVAIEEPSLPPAAVEDAVSRFDAFRTAVKNDQPPPPLILSEDDINALLYHHPLFEPVAGQMKVAIEDEQLSSRMSLDLDGFDIPLIGGMLEGKYFNGRATFRLATEQGEPAVYLEGVEMNGQQVPEQAMTSLSQENLLKEFASDPQMKQFFDRLEKLAIEDGKLKIVPAQQGGGTAP